MSDELYTSQELVEKTTDIAKCPNCGANTEFDPQTQTLKCLHCFTTLNFNTTEKAEEQSINNLLTESEKWSDETHVFKCNNCGALEVLAKTEIAKNCSFCGTSNIVKTSELSGLKPNAIVPFKISKPEASEKVTVWAKKKFFAPKDFKRSAEVEKISGTYNPVFTFDSKTTSVYSGRLGKRYTQTRRVNGRTQTVTKIRYFYIKGTFSDFFDDILIQASSNIKQKNINELAPFNTNNSSAYNQNYLNGFIANQYTRDGQSCWNDARKVIDTELKKRILKQYDYDVVDSLTINTQCSNVTFKYLLIPIYVGHFNFRQKLFNFFINGFNGKISGKAPLSPIKVGLAALLGIGLLAGAVAAIALFLI